jgi:cytochrome c biogenesis protein CcmG/thiol:disulfide interchange protein DsbE
MNLIKNKKYFLAIILISDNYKFILQILKQTIMKNLIFTLLTLFTINQIFAQAQKQTLPDINLKDLNGKLVNVGDYSRKGKIVIVSFWATWCTPCKKELNNISDLYEEWKSKYDVTVVAVTIDNARNVMKVKPYVDGQAWPFDVLLDVNSDLMRAMNVINPPHTFLIDKTGNVVYSHTGYLEGDEFTLEEKIKALAK